MVRTLKEIKKQIEVAQEIKADEGWWDLKDKWALYGYLHGLLWVSGKLKPKYEEK